MLVNISGNQMYVSDALKQFAKAELSRVLENYLDTSYVNVVLSMDKKEHVAVGNMVFLGEEIQASSRTDDMYRSIVAMSAELEQRLAKRRELVKSHPNVKLLFEQNETGARPH